MSELRDLEADRCLSRQSIYPSDPAYPAFERVREALAAALDEIDRLKRLLVEPAATSGDSWYAKPLEECYPTEADAWAAVRKAANDGK